MSDKGISPHITTRLATIAGVVLLVTMQLLSSSVAGIKIGMVLQVKGEIFPPVEQFSQLISQKTFDLSENAYLELAIYADCKIIQINGPGLLNIQDELLWSGDEFGEKTNNNCVKPLIYTNPDLETAGINLRGENTIARMSRLQINETLSISSRPVIIFDGFTKLSNHELIITGNGQQFNIQLNSPVTHWPANEISLVPGMIYQFHLATGQRVSGENYKSRVTKNDKRTNDHPEYLVIRLQ